jgi:hypothetical protein
MTARLIPLQQWAKLTYGDAAPCSNTLRKWARGDKIMPPAEKHGRGYFVTPDARYATPEADHGTHDHVKTRRLNQENTESASQLIQRIINGGRKTQTA